MSTTVSTPAAVPDSWESIADDDTPDSWESLADDTPVEQVAKPPSPEICPVAVAPAPPPVRVIAYLDPKPKPVAQAYFYKPQLDLTGQQGTPAGLEPKPASKPAPTSWYERGMIEFSDSEDEAAAKPDQQSKTRQEIERFMLENGKVPLYRTDVNGNRILSRRQRGRSHRY